MSEPKSISVTELVTAFKEVVETALPPVCVQAEISNCRRSAAGHYYLTLKDDRSEIGAVIWRSTASRLKFEPKDGSKVVAHGSLQVYVARGSCQFIISRLQPHGIGALELALRELRQRLEAEGLFDPERKRPLPAIPRRIALVTSPTSAAVKDMIQVISRRWPAAKMVVVPVPVQGDAAAPRIAAGIRAAATIPGVDVIITGRGGGSLEDLWPFNEETVARSIAESPVPVVSAVGHEIDVSISDLVADRRALTPSEAGELVVMSAQDLRQQLLGCAAGMRRTMAERVERCRLRLQAIETRSVFERPASLIDERRQLCDDLAARADRAVRMTTERTKQQVATIAASLDALSPLKVLARGYSLTTRDDQSLVRSIDDVEPDSRIHTRVDDGMIISMVQSVEKLSGR